MFPLFVLFILFFIVSLAKTNRAPFDLPEAEAELVSGYNVEYSGLGFTLFFLGEYSNMIMMSFLMTSLFLGGQGCECSLVIGNSFIIMFFLYMFIIIRATLPRYRYDQLMIIG